MEALVNRRFFLSSSIAVGAFAALSRLPVDAGSFLQEPNSSKSKGIKKVIKTDGEWKSVLTLEHEPGSELSYPAVIQAADGLAHITYTWKRQRIRHAIVDPKKLY